MRESTDLRAVRTKKGIFDSFIQLLEDVEFDQITVRQITEKANINRATFYRHFEDKYDLLEKIIQEDLIGNVVEELQGDEIFNHALVERLFISLTEFHLHLSTRCQRSYDRMSFNMERVLKNELKKILYPALIKKYPYEKQESLQSLANILSWTIYGAAMDWREQSKKSARAYLEELQPTFEKLMHN